MPRIEEDRERKGEKRYDSLTGLTSQFRWKCPRSAKNQTDGTSVANGQGREINLVRPLNELRVPSHKIILWLKIKGPHSIWWRMRWWLYYPASALAIRGTIINSALLVNDSVELQQFCDGRSFVITCNDKGKLGVKSRVLSKKTTTVDWWIDAFLCAFIFGNFPRGLAICCIICLLIGVWQRDPVHNFCNYDHV